MHAMQTVDVVSAPRIATLHEEARRFALTLVIDQPYLEELLRVRGLDGVALLDAQRPERQMLRNAYDGITEWHTRHLMRVPRLAKCIASAPWHASAPVDPSPATAPCGTGAAFKSIAVFTRLRSP